MRQESFAQKSVYWLKVVSLGLILGIGIQFAQAWTNPGATPPGGNVSGPLTTGAGNQTKSSGSIFLAGAGSLFAGRMVVAPQLCIGADCRNAWPSSGITSITGGPCTVGQVVKSISSGGVVTCGSDTDPTVIASVKDGVSWNEVTDKPTQMSGSVVAGCQSYAGDCWGGASVGGDTSFGGGYLLCPAGTRAFNVSPDNGRGLCIKN
ncbi:MAG: hypothetical protein QG581_177 [Patescibacteria group bacterium]|jgi:hypothetical protein|nr:hypothetical protein [Patescibacteria group bacterium]